MSLDIDNTYKRTYFVDVILPLSVKGSFTYRVPEEYNEYLEVGKRVIVQFGKSKIYTGIIISISDKAPNLYEAKYILDLIDEFPIVNLKQLELFYWIADYYLCEWGEVLQAALPSALKLASETRIILNSNTQIEKSVLSDKEFLIVDALELRSELLISEISKIVNQKSVYTLIRNLYDKEIIHIYEDIQNKYKPKSILLLQLNEEFNQNDNLKNLFKDLESKPKQLNVILAYLKLEKSKINITKSKLAEESDVTISTIQTLIKKNIFIIKAKNVSRLGEVNNSPLNNINLSEHQILAINRINEAFENDKIALLHGVTSSGKTLLYVKLMHQALEEGKQILYLLPEIALTSQIVERLQNYFTQQIFVYHSKFNDNERAEVWQKVLKNDSIIVIGARSSVFLPFKNLGLIIVDEEHEASFKQYDPAPRYNAKDVAIMLSKFHQSKILLGSATPSIESYYQVIRNKYALIELKERFGLSNLPLIKVASLADDGFSGLQNQYLSNSLITEINKALENRKQVILFQNRRGYVPVIICKTCGHTPKCVHCDVSLTYHKSSNKLHCHYCGYKQDNMALCASCGSSFIEQKGYGTEKIEEDIKLIFPNAKVGRMDYDTTKNKFGHEKILNEFENGSFDILVGTQMVAKGIDFKNVSTIGVINADGMLKLPDFRAYERSFQMLSQVSGRAGRRDNKGLVIIQAYDIQNRILKYVIDNDYQSMINSELAERERYNYPPFARIIRIDLKHKDEIKLLNIASEFTNLLKIHFNNLVYGPEKPLISRIKSYYIQSIIIKVDVKHHSLSKIKKIIKSESAAFYQRKINKGAILQIDVDPY